MAAVSLSLNSSDSLLTAAVRPDTATVTPAMTGLPDFSAVMALPSPPALRPAERNDPARPSRALL